MKRKLTKLFFILTILMSVTITFSHNAEVLAARQRIDEYDGNRGVLSYAVENNEAVFLGYHAYDMSIREYQIPTKIDGYTVTVIGENAFYDSTFEKITIPDTIKKIENYAFGGFSSNLKELIIPDAVTDLGEMALNYCPSIEKIVIGSGIKEIPQGFFGSAPNVKSVTLGSNVEILGNGAFSGCMQLETVIIPPKVKTIGEFAFMDCPSLKSITIPDSVTTIGEAAFHRCPALETVVIGNGVTELPRAVFEENPMLKKVVIGKNVRTIGEAAFMNCRALETFNFPAGLKTIDRLAFWGCSSLKSVSIPDSVESLGECAFIECTSLEKLIVGSGIKTMGDSAFGYCVALKNVTIKNGVAEIGKLAFSGTEALREINIPDSVVVLGEGAFNCSGIESVKLGNGLKRIEEGAFSTCPNLKSVHIPDSVTYMGKDAFCYNDALETVVIGNGLEEIPPCAFQYCFSLQSVYFGDNVKKIEGSAFEFCSLLKDVKLNVGLQIIGNSAFNGCGALTEIKIPNTVTEIGDWAFHSCTKLENVSIGYSVQSIGEAAFEYCKSLKELYIPVSVKALEYNTFYDTGLTDIIYGGTEAQWQKVVCWIPNGGDITIHFGKKIEGLSTATTKSENVYRRMAVVYKNLNDMTTSRDNYVICTDAKITFEGNEYTADKNGIVPLPESNCAVTVSAPGYRTEVLEYWDYMNGIGIFLEKETDLPIIKSVKLGKDEIRRSSEKFSKNTSEQFWVDVDFNGHDNCEVYIENGNNKWIITSQGYSGMIDIGQHFNRWSGCRVVVKMQDGRILFKWLETGYSPAALEPPLVTFENKFSNLGSGTIPYLDTIKFDFSVPNFPFDITVSGEKVVATFGVDVTKWKYSGEKGEWDNQYNAHKSLAEVIKNSHERMGKEGTVAEEYSKLVKDLGSAKKNGIKSKFGFDANITALGYLEGTIDDKGVYFSDGGVIFVLEAEGGFSNQGILMVGPTPVPYNWEAMLKGELEAKFQLAQREARTESLTPKGTIGGSVGLKVGAGPGIKDVHLNFCVEGSLDPLLIYTYDSSEFKLDANVGVFVEATLGPYEHHFYLNKKTFNLYPKPEQTMLKARSFSALDYEVIGRDYLEEQSEFVANNGVALFALRQEDETVLKTNTFKVSDPQMADLGAGKRIVAWVDDDINVDALNGRTVMYSYFDGSTWSDQQYVDRNGMGAFNPQIKKVGTKVYLVWESINTVLTNTSTPMAMLENKEIKYAVFNETTCRFENITMLTDNDYTDTDPVINDVSGTAVITWVTNSESDTLSANSHNALCYAVVDGATVIRTQTAAEELNLIESHVAIGDAENVEVMYIADTDGNCETNSDNKLFSSYYGQLTADDSVTTSLQAVDGVVYFYNGGNLINYKEGIQRNTGVVLPHDKFVVLADNKTVVYSDRNGAASDIYASFYDETAGRYSKAVKMTDMGEYYLEDISGFENHEGALVLAFNKRHIAGDFMENIGTLYGQSDLSTVVVMPKRNITLDYVYADVNSIVPGFDTVIEADITNSGSQTIKALNITLYDGNGNSVAGKDAEIKLLPGESTTLTLKYFVPEDFSGFDGKVVVTVEDDSNKDDNSLEISLMCRDIAVQNLSYAANENGTYTVYAEITNGSLTEENEIIIKLMREDTVVEEKVVDTLGKLESTILAFENILAGNTYCVVAQELENETMLGNNDEFITIASTDDGLDYTIDGVILKTTEDGISISADVIADEEKTENTMLIVALYDNLGTLVSMKPIPVDFKGEKIKSVTDTMDACEFESAKIMLWNSLLKPLASPIE